MKKRYSKPSIYCIESSGDVLLRLSGAEAKIIETGGSEDIPFTNDPQQVFDPAGQEDLGAKPDHSSLWDY